MFLTDEQWRTIEEPSAALGQLEQICGDPRQRSILKRIALRDAALGKVTLPGARRRKLSFYQDAEIVEIELDLMQHGFGGDHGSGFLSALVIDGEARLLDGSSVVIHDANSAGQGDAGPLRVQLETNRQARDYVAFFCTYVSGEEGPFMLVEDERDFEWGSRHGSEEAVAEDFDTLLKRRRQERSWTPMPVVLTRTMLEAYRDSDGNAEALFGSTFDPEFAAAKENPAAPIEVTRRPGEGAEWSIEAIVWYGNSLFRSEFLLKTDGTITMEGDTLLKVSPKRGWSVIADTALFTRAGERRLVSPQAARDMLCGTAEPAAGATEHSSARGKLSNVRVNGDLDLSTADYREGFELSNVEIDGDLVLSNGRYGRAIRLDDVKIVKSLRADRMACPEFRAHQVEAHGLYEKTVAKGDPSPAVDFSESRIEGAFSFCGSRAFGGFRAERLLVSGGVSLWGLSVLQREYGSDEGRTPGEGCVFSQADFGGEVTFRKRDERAARASLTFGMESRITGGLTFRGARVTRDLSLSGVSALARLKLARPLAPADITEEAIEAAAGGDQRSPCPIVYDPAGKTVHATDAEGAANLDLSSMTAGGTVEAGEWRRAGIQGDINLRNAAVTGNCEFSRVDVSGAFLLEGTLVEGTLRLTSTTAYAVFGRFARIGQDFRFEAYLGERNWISGNLDLPDCEVRGYLSLFAIGVGGDIDLSGARLGQFAAASDDEITRVIIAGDVSLREAEIDRHVHISGLRLERSLNLSGVAVGGMLDGDSSRYLRTEIGGALDMSGARIGSDTRFSAAVIGDSITAITGSFGRIQLRGAMMWLAPAETGADPTAVFEPLKVKSILLQSVQARLLDLKGTCVERDIDVSDCDIGEIGCAHSDPAKFLCYHWEPVERERMADGVPAAHELRVEIGGNLIARVARIGAVDLRNVRCESVEFEQVQVNASINLAADAHGPAMSDTFCAEIGRFVLRSSIVGGDVHLDGLDVGGEMRVVETEIRGNLRLANEHSAIHVRDEVTVDLSDLTVQHLTLGTSNQVGDLNIRLTRAKVGRLEIHRPPPIQIDASHSTIENWQFDKVEGSLFEKPLPEEVEELRGFLRATAPFDRAVYTSAEQWLRQRGDDESADQVHIDMRWRAALGTHERDQAGRDRPGAGRQLAMILKSGVMTRRGISLIAGCATSFWTAGERPLLWLTALLLPISILVSIPRENMEPSDVFLQTSEAMEQKLTSDEIPDAGQWSIGRRVHQILSNHVPIVPIVSDAKWELADDRPLLIGAGGHVWRIPFLTPADYGLAIRIAFWIAWPLFLIGVAANIQRRRS